MPKKVLAWIAAGAAAASLDACNVQPTAEVAVFGDSVSWGYGDLPGGWVKRVEQATGYSFTNLAVPGERTDAAADRIDPALRTAPGASVVIVLHGGNDWIRAFQSSWCNRNCDPSEVDNQYLAVGDKLRRISDGIAKRKKKAVFLTYWPTSPAKCPTLDAAMWDFYNRHRLRLNSEISKVATEKGDVLLHTEDLATLGTDSNDFYDCLHPSAQGYAKIADRILQDVDTWAPEESRQADAFKYVP